jgi:hypothetical protein
MSRAKSIDQIGIVRGKKIKWGVLEKTIDSKIKGHEKHDKEKGRTCDLTVPYVRCLMVRQGFQCAKQCNCNGDMKLSWEVSHDPQQFTIDRIDIKKGHVKGNVMITCLSCNSASSLNSI